MRRLADPVAAATITFVTSTSATDTDRSRATEVSNLVLGKDATVKFARVMEDETENTLDETSTVVAFPVDVFGSAAVKALTIFFSTS